MKISLGSFGSGIDPSVFVKAADIVNGFARSRQVQISTTTGMFVGLEGEREQCYDVQALTSEMKHELVMLLGEIPVTIGFGHLSFVPNCAVRDGGAGTWLQRLLSQNFRPVIGILSYGMRQH